MFLGVETGVYQRWSTRPRYAVNTRYNGLYRLSSRALVTFSFSSMTRRLSSFIGRSPLRFFSSGSEFRAVGGTVDRQGQVVWAGQIPFWLVDEGRPSGQIFLVILNTPWCKGKGQPQSHWIMSDGDTSTDEWALCITHFFSSYKALLVDDVHLGNSTNYPVRLSLSVGIHYWSPRRNTRLWFGGMPFSLFFVVLFIFSSACMGIKRACNYAYSTIKCEKFQ